MQIMKVVGGGGGKAKASKGGSHAGTRYISERERDREREGDHARPLFTQDEDGLSWQDADRELSVDRTAPEQGSLLHLVLSLEAEDYARLGDTEQERRDAFVEVVRETMEQFEQEIGVNNLRWAGGIHRNTEHPHATV